MKLPTRIQLSVMMFLEFFIWGVWMVPLGTYLSSTLAIPGSMVGWIYSTNAIGAIISPFFIGIFADRFFAAQKLLGIMHLLGAGALYLTAQTQDTWAIFWLLLVYSALFMPTIALVNSISFNQMKNPETEFPSIRVLGTIGWIIAGLSLNFVFRPLLGGEQAIELTASPLLIAAGVSGILGVYSFFLPNTPPANKGARPTVRDILGLDTLALMKERSFATFIISSLLICIPLSFYYNWTNPFLVESGMENVTAKMSMGQMSELIFMLLIPFFFKRLGVKWMLIIGMLAWVTRYALFAYGDASPSMIWMLYGGIILHGICYDFFFVTGMIYVDKKAPVELRSSAQGFIAFVTYGCGMLIGYVLAGQIVEGFTGEDGSHAWRSIWLIPAGMAAVITLLFGFLFSDSVRKDNLERSTKTTPIEGA